jgi:uncharacterized protein (DUF433 family)
MVSEGNSILEVAAYGLPEAARYLRVPGTTLRYWTQGRGDVDPLIELASLDPARLSFSNLMECHVLSAMRGATYRLRLPKIRRALETVSRLFPSRHPLLERAFQTDGVDLFIEELPKELVNLSKNGQLGIKSVLQFHLQRIERDGSGILTFFPFVEERSAQEPKVIMMNPTVAFGKPVIAGTGISTATVAARFHARESVSDLAREYGRQESEIEEAIRWESKAIAA